MKLRISRVAFAIAYCTSYIVVLAMDWPLFRYYPLTGEFSWGWHHVAGSGPAMAWYGLMANAGMAALVCAAISRDHTLAAVLRNYLWLFPCAAMLGCVFLMRQFFL